MALFIFILPVTSTFNVALLSFSSLILHAPSLLPPSLAEISYLLKWRDLIRLISTNMWMTEPCLYSHLLGFEKRLLAFLEYIWFVEFWVIDEET